MPAASNVTEFEFFKKRLSLTERLLNVKQKQIDSLLDITKAVNSNLPITTLVRIYENTLHAQLGVKQIAFFIKDDEERWQCISNTSGNRNVELLSIDKLLQGTTSVVPTSRLETTLSDEYEFLIPVFHKKAVIGYVFISKMSDDQTDAKEEKLKFIQTITNIIVVANENKKLFRKQIDQMVLQKELHMAAEMQNLLVPARLPSDHQVEASKFYRPHKNIGGDYFDFIRINENEVFFCISDISGKGIPAALLMANFQAYVRMLIMLNYPMDETIRILNAKAIESTRYEKYITMFAARYNYETRLLTYVNGGHNPSILYQNGKAELLETGTTIIGMFDTLKKLEVGEVKIEPGALLVNYTDGISESTNAEGRMFETEGIIDHILKYPEVSTEELNRSLVEAVIQFRQSTDFDDDLTLLTLRFL